MIHFILSIVGFVLAWLCVEVVYTVIKVSGQVALEKLPTHDATATDRFTQFERDGTNY